MCVFYKAFLHLVKLQQEEAERQQKKEDEERKRIAEERKRIKRMLEAAFEGDVDAMKQILKEVHTRCTHTWPPLAYLQKCFPFCLRTKTRIEQKTVIGWEIWPLKTWPRFEMWQW